MRPLRIFRNFTKKKKTTLDKTELTIIIQSGQSIIFYQTCVRSQFNSKLCLIKIPDLCGMSYVKN